MTFSTRTIGITIAFAAVVLAGSIWPSVIAAQTLQTSHVMQQKLAESQLLLGDVVTSNWAGLDRHTRALDALTKAPGWDALHLPEFHNQTTAFQKALESLLNAAAQRDQQMAVAAYNELVSSCVACHRYVARSRIAMAR